jgi:hypothetical protein
VGRRRRSSEDNFLDLVKAGAGVVLLVGVLASTQPRLLDGIFSGMMLIGLGLVAIVVLVIVLYPLSKKRNGTGDVSLSTLEVVNPRAVLKSNSVSSPAQFVSLPHRPSAECLRGIDWFQFEKVMAALYDGSGREVQRRGGANPDGGIDFVIHENSQRIAVQCKHWKQWKVGIRHVREFYGGMKAEGFDQGIFVTLQGWSFEAKEFALNHGINLVDEAGIKRMLAQANPLTLGVIEKIMNDQTKHCPKCGAAMVLRTARRGLNAGSQFWGCSTYPRCNQKMRLG